MEITTIGLDLAKNVYQVHAINGAGEVIVRKALRRAQVLRFFERLDPCLVGIEACGTTTIGRARSGSLATRCV
jgi:transposase